MGTVYVFNASAHPVRLMINNSGSPGDAIPAVPCPAKSPTPYTPFEQQIKVTNSPNSGNVFVYGQANSIQVQSQLENARATLTFPTAPKSPAPDSLWLYVFYTEMVLFYPTGKIIQLASFKWQ